MEQNYDYLVIGSGLAGLTYAIQVAHYGSVALLTKKNRTDANSSWAQGGIAGVLDTEGDSFELHVQDTLTAGAGLCHEDAVQVLVEEGPQRIRELIELGAQFDTAVQPDGHTELSLGREGGHSRNRIVHTADYTGWECEKTLLEAVRRHPNIELFEHYFVTDLIVRDAIEGRMCAGAYALNGQTSETVEFHAKATLLATGGSGQVYLHTTNPLIATGDGVAMAWRAGAEIANMEFVQFHPTTLYHPDARAFLITEALRGEGGILKHEDGEAFMERYHPLKDLAPRDIVARAIVSEMKRRDVPCVFLDATGIDADKIKHHFPTVYERCLSVGIDITIQPIPVVPAQHYQCGGVQTDLNGFTGVGRLYAAGEVACTGVHGANRLASNSLLEAMVYGYRAALHTIKHCNLPLPQMFTRASVGSVPKYFSPFETEGIPEPHTLRTQIQDVMQSNVGIVRTTAELTETETVLKEALRLLDREVIPSVESYEVRNIAQVALIIVQSAKMRHESRGLHYTLDYPDKVESERHDTVVSRTQTATH